MSASTRQLEGRAVTVMGLGLFGGGAAVARFLADRGARVTVTDLRSEEELAPALRELAGVEATFALGQHREEDFSRADLVVVNPAVPPRSRFLAVAREAGVALTSEIALFLDHTPARVVAVTGTQGKSSTTNFLAQLLRAAFPEQRVFLGGNIGRSLLADLDEMSPTDLCALELSSYQLERLPEDMLRERAASPIEVAVLTNVLTDHLERHGTREAYATAKLRLLEVLRPGGSALLPAEGLPVTASPAPDLRVISHPGTCLLTTDEGLELEGELLAPLESCSHLVPFQRDNLHLALAAARLMGAPREALAAAAREVRGLPHRLDLVGELRGRRLYDNAVSTTPDSTISALHALPSGSTVMLGGKVKDIDLAPLLEAAASQAAKVVIFGAAREPWAPRFRALGLEVREAEGPRQALAAATELGEGDLLFSPACSSFDAYSNFKARADDLLDAARELGLTPRAQSPS